jgi:hypothetical protein
MTRSWEGDFCQLCGDEIDLDDTESYWEAEAEELYNQFRNIPRDYKFTIRVHIECLEIEEAH